MGQEQQHLMGQEQQHVMGQEQASDGPGAAACDGPGAAAIDSESTMDPIPSSSSSVSSADGAGLSVTSAPSKASSGKMLVLMGHIPVARKPPSTLEGVQALIHA